MEKCIMIHKLLVYLVHQFVLHAYLDIQQLQGYFAVNQNEVALHHANFQSGDKISLHFMSLARKATTT